MSKVRGFESVDEKFIVNKEIFTNEKKQKFEFPIKPKLPTRTDKRSAGYDFYLQKDLKLLPMQKTVISTDIKAYMPEDEALFLFIRSSLAIKQGLMLSNNVGIVDSSYYNNEGDGGNIGFAVVNTTGITIELKAGERIGQGVFMKYLVADEDICTSEVRIGGFGSSGK
jgi:dUTP pyrophosphatase